MVVIGDNHKCQSKTLVDWKPRSSFVESSMLLPAIDCLFVMHTHRGGRTRSRDTLIIGFHSTCAAVLYTFSHSKIGFTRVPATVSANTWQIS